MRTTTRHKKPPDSRKTVPDGMRSESIKPRIGLRNGNIWISAGGRCFSLDLNEDYRGYLPSCRYTAVAEVRGTYYACGSREDGRLMLVSSGDGKTWAERPAGPEQDPFSPEMRGDAVSILADPDSGELLIVCAGGVAEILPDCPRCARAVRVSRKPVTAAKILGMDLVLYYKYKEINRVTLQDLIRHRINLEYAVRNGYTLVDLRPQDRADPLPLPALPLAPGQLLNAKPDAAKLALFAEEAEMADRTADMLVRKGWSNARSLGDPGTMLLI